MNQITVKGLALQYFIIMPNKVELTLFNLLDNNLVESINILNFIESLPCNFGELYNDWPLTSLGKYMIHEDIKYDIIYIYQENLKEYLEKMKDSLKPTIGCFFLLNDINKDNVDNLLKLTKMPILSNDKKYVNDKIFPLDISNIDKVLKIWENTINLFLDDSENKFTISKFNNKTNIKTKNPLEYPAAVRGNVLTINRLCGIYTPINFNNTKYEDNNIDIENLQINLFRELIANKLMLFCLSYYYERDGNCEKRYQDKIDELFISTEEIQKILKDKDESIYIECIRKIIDKFEDINIKTDVIISMPSVNKFILEEMNGYLGKKRFSNKEMRKIVGQSQYEINSNIEDIKEEKKQIIKYFFNDRSKEIQFINILYIFFALARKSPYITTKNIDGSNLGIKYKELKNLLKTSEVNSDKVSDVNKRIMDISNIMRDGLSEKLWNMILKHSYGKHIKLFSDMPIEWLKQEKLPFRLCTSLSRIPITPMDGVIKQAYLNQTLELNLHKIKIGIVNTIDKTKENQKELYDYGFGLFRFLTDKFGENVVRYIEPNDKKDFVKFINDESLDIFIYYGHGYYNEKIQRGCLCIKDDYIDSVTLQQEIEKMPPIVILGACETEVTWGSYLDVANMVLNTGAISVIGTMFEVDGHFTWYFIMKLIWNLFQVKTRNDMKEIKWNEVLLDAFRTMYLREPLYSMKKKFLNLNIEQIFSEFCNICKNENLDDMERCIRRDEFYLQLFKKMSQKYYEYYRLLINKEKILPQSSFYTSLGSPEKIIFK